MGPHAHLTVHSGTGGPRLAVVASCSRRPSQASCYPMGLALQACHYCPGRSYVAAGFVKWIEAAGARAVPIRCADCPALTTRAGWCRQLQPWRSSF